MCLFIVILIQQFISKQRFACVQPGNVIGHMRLCYCLPFWALKV